MKKEVWISCLLVLVFSIINGQSENLMINGGFEDYAECPNRSASIETWTSHVTMPTTSTISFTPVVMRTSGVPINNKGTQESSEGEAYAGLIFYALDESKEYLQMKMKRGLQRSSLQSKF